MTERGGDTDPTGARSIEADTDPGSPQGRARQDVRPAKDGAEDLDRILGGLRSEGHFRPEPKQTASTNGESFAAHSVAPHSLPAATTDPELDRILLDITSPDGISPETGAEPDDASAVTVPLPRPTTRAPSPQEDVATGPDMFRVLREQRRRERVALYGLCAVVLAGLIGGWIAIRPSSPASPRRERRIGRGARGDGYDACDGDIGGDDSAFRIFVGHCPSAEYHHSAGSTKAFRASARKRATRTPRRAPAACEPERGRG